MHAGLQTHSEPVAPLSSPQPALYPKCLQPKDIPLRFLIPPESWCFGYLPLFSICLCCPFLSCPSLLVSFAHILSVLPLSLFPGSLLSWSSPLGWPCSIYNFPCSQLFQMTLAILSLMSTKIKISSQPCLGVVRFSVYSRRKWNNQIIDIYSNLNTFPWNYAEG